MRISLLLLGIVASVTAAEGTSIGVWNHQLLVTAPATGSQTLPGGNQRLTVDWRGTTLDEAAAFLRSATLVNVVVMPGCGDRTLTLTVKDMSLANVVQWISSQTGAAWSYQNQALVFSAEPLRGAQVTKLYDISDLSAEVRDFPGPEMELASNSGKGIVCFPTEAPRTKPDTEEIAEFLRRQLHIE